jgi:hypothetical protein
MIAFSFVAQGWKHLESDGEKFRMRVVEFAGKQVSYLQVLSISNQGETVATFHSSAEHEGDAAGAKQVAEQLNIKG